MKHISILALAFFTFFVLTPWQKSQAHWGPEPKIITFDVPGAGTGAGQGTTPAFVDARGVIVGFYVDAANVNHGFLRDPDGTITTFDAPGAGTGAGQGTVPQQSNPAGAITGMYFDANCLYHGFVRDPDGTFTTFEVPEAGTVGGTCTTSIWWLVMKGTSAQNINATGTISGNYTDPSGVGHIFLRAPEGAFTTVDAPGAGTESVQGTWTAGPNNLNPAGSIIGWSVDSGNALHAFLRTARGKVSTFDAPGAGRGAIQGTVPLSLNPENAITGFYLDGHSVFHGFVRSPFGKLTTFDVSGSGTGFFQGTYPANINAVGEVAGYYTDTNNVSHGFVRDPWGMLTTFDVPEAGAGAYQGTFPWVNNAEGAIVGNYVDANGVSHGFWRRAVDHGRHEQHLIANLASRTTGITVNPGYRAHVMQDGAEKIWELGTYPGGTWAAMGDVNDFGVAVAQGDVPDGSTHNFAVPLFGPRAGEWIDLGTLGGTESGWEEGLITISNTGVIVGHSATTDQNRPHAVAWTEKSGVVDLGTLADIGYPAYNSSYASGVNRMGTLIVGWSGVEDSCIGCAPTLPVVWTPSVVWKNGRAVVTWTIHKLDTTGFDAITNWYAWAVNDFGQIVGEGGNDNGEFVGAIWTPLKNGTWKISMLPAVAGYPNSEPFNINDRGEISGDIEPADFSVWSPAFWKPLDPSRKTYSNPIVLPMPKGGYTNCYTDGINELGDLTGECWGDDVDQAVRWTTKDTTYSQVLGFPGDWSWSFRVNNSRIAVVTYGGGDKCSADTYGSCGGAIQFH